jgi:hypothetical protein
MTMSKHAMAVVECLRAGVGMILRTDSHTRVELGLLPVKNEFLLGEHTAIWQ